MKHALLDSLRSLEDLLVSFVSHSSAWIILLETCAGLGFNWTRKTQAIQTQHYPFAVNLFKNDESSSGEAVTDLSLLLCSFQAAVSCQPRLSIDVTLVLLFSSPGAHYAKGVQGSSMRQIT